MSKNPFAAILERNTFWEKSKKQSPQPPVPKRGARTYPDRFKPNLFIDDPSFPLRYPYYYAVFQKYDAQKKPARASQQEEIVNTVEEKDELSSILENFHGFRFDKTNEETSGLDFYTGFHFGDYIDFQQFRNDYIATCNSRDNDKTFCGGFNYKVDMYYPLNDPYNITFKKESEKYLQKSIKNKQFKYLEQKKLMQTNFQNSNNYEKQIDIN